MASLQSYITSQKFLYTKSPEHASYNFGQKNQSLFINQPRLPFEFYVGINLNNVGTAKSYISQHFNSQELNQIPPLVKSIDMPSMKIETTPLNQYNRKRLNQTKVMFDPIKIVLHDVADGKTLKFWEMYYRYYFGDGNEPGVNSAKQKASNDGIYATEQRPTTPISTGTTGGGQSSSAYAAIDPRRVDLQNTTSPNLPTNTIGTKSTTENIIADTLNSQLFGYNLPTVQNVRNLIQSIDIYQVHGGRFNQVTLVNPRISAFTHDNLNYAAGDRSVELTFTIEYEYAYYNIKNMLLGGTESNNTSSTSFFQNGAFLELPNFSFSATVIDLMQSTTPIFNVNEVAAFNSQNTQSKLGSLVSGTFPQIADVNRVSSSVLGGTINLQPNPIKTASAAYIQAKSFVSSAAQQANAEYRATRAIYQDVTGTINNEKNMYQDIKRIKIGKYFGG
jgi:hypothetical protein